MATKLVQDPGNGSPRIPAGQPSIYASSDEWAAYRQRQAAEAMPPKDSPEFGVVVNDPALQALYSMLTQPGYESPAGAGRGGPASTGIDATDLNSPAGAGRGFVNPAQGTNSGGVDSSADFLSAAFPEIFRKTPPQGIVNTTFGVERVNARTSETGVTAIKGPDGKVTLTNLDKNGQKVQGTGSPNSVGGNGMATGMNQPLTGNQQLLMPNVSTSLQAAMRSLQDPNTTVDAALGHYANVQQEIALQQTKMQGDAIKFAETQFGIPDLNAQLQASLIADKNSPSWYPGIGDSPVTIRIRQAIQSASNDVQIAAQNYLKANTSYSALLVSSETAKNAMNQNEIRNNRKDAAQERVDINAESRAAAKLEERVRLGATLPPEAQNRLQILNPELRNLEGDRKLAAIGDKIKASANDKPLQDYLTAPQVELPAMAISGNNYAMTAVKAGELAIGRTESAIQADIDAINNMVNDRGFAEKAIRAKYSNSSDKVGMEKELMDLRNAKSGSLDATGKAMRRQADINMAIDFRRKEVANAPIGNILNLSGADTVLGDSIKAAMKVSGNASIQSVLTAYIGDASGPERMQKIAAFSEAVKGLVAKQPQSVFGMPNATEIAGAIANATTGGLGQWIRDRQAGVMKDYQDEVAASRRFKQAISLD